MPLYRFVAHDAEGRVHEDTIEAGNLDAAVDALRVRRLTVSDVKPVEQPLPPKTVRPVSDILATDPSRPVLIEEREYLPLTDTLRLYAGWLLAWYAVVYLLGSYQLTKELPFQIDIIEQLFLSKLVLYFAFGTFAFLLVTSIHRVLGRGVFIGLVMTVLWGVLVYGFYVNV